MNLSNWTLQLNLANHFGFFFRRVLEGETVFGFLTGLAGLFFTIFTATFFFGKTGFATGFTGFLGSTFLLGSVFFVAIGFATGLTGFFAGVLAADFTNGNFFTAFFAGFVGFAGFVTGFVGFAAGLGFATLGGSFGAGGLLAGGTTGLTSLTGGATSTGADGVGGDGVGGDGVKTGEIQLRLTASRSIALNCDSNSGESGTS